MNLNEKKLNEKVKKIKLNIKPLNFEKISKIDVNT